MASLYIYVGIIFSIGLHTILSQRNVIKIVIGMGIIESSIILLLVILSYRPGGAAPILDGEYGLIVDPIPQALALTAIVIGASTTALMLALIIKIFKDSKSLDIIEISHLKG